MTEAIARATLLSRYARRLLAMEPELLDAESVQRPFRAAEMRVFLEHEPTRTEADLKRALRILRKRVMLRLIARDLGGLADLAEVLATMTELADLAIHCVVEHVEGAMAEQYGTPIGADTQQRQRMHVIAMGKLGGRELNVSSDIDLIFVYAEEGTTRGGRALSNHEFFIRCARQFIALLNEMTEDGYVFRVDMRLRPSGADGPLACSFAMLENYFVTQGREWERYAWIKARIVCGDRPRELVELIRPFVFRRYFDFSAHESLRDLHQQVRREVERRDMFDNVKLGPGGIREIEFIAQLFQLIRGGREPALQEQSTLAILPLLTERGLLAAEVRQGLQAAYVFLRNLEHRLQYLDDKQTQKLPANGEDQALIAQAMGYSSYDTFTRELECHRAIVTAAFENIFKSTADNGHELAGLWREGEDSARLELLRARGYAQPKIALERLSALRTGARVQQMAPASQERLARLIPLIVEACAQLPDPDTALARMLTLLESVTRREGYLALLLEYPQTIAQGARLAAASPWAAEYLARHPILLDELLDARTLHAPPDWPALVALLRRQLDETAGDHERQMDILRHFKHAQVMRLLAQDLGGELRLETLSDHLSYLADIILAEVLRIVWHTLRAPHRDQPAFAIVAYGKLGGKELGYASDLDLIFVHDDPAPVAAENYGRLAQRINHWLTSFTPAGILYESDLRLRPDGASGLLVSSIAGFAEYQNNKAWVWEHQALTRARCVAGDAALCTEFETIRVGVLRKARNLAELRAEVIGMRAKMLAGHPNAGDRFDIKHDRGGLIDVEFIVQYLILGYAAQHAELTANIGNLALLKLAARLGLIDIDLGQAAHDAYRRLRELQHARRLQGDKYARVESNMLVNEIAAVKKLWAAVLKS